MVKNKKAPTDTGSAQNSNSSRVLEMRFANVSGRVGEVKDAEETKDSSFEDDIGSPNENF